MKQKTIASWLHNLKRELYFCIEMNTKITIRSVWWRIYARKKCGFWRYFNSITTGNRQIIHFLLKIILLCFWTEIISNYTQWYIVPVKSTNSNNAAAVIVISLTFLVTFYRCGRNSWCGNAWMAWFVDEKLANEKE